MISGPTHQVSHEGSEKMPIPSEALSLRLLPRRALRLKRNTIIAAFSFVVATLSLLAWWALRTGEEPRNASAVDGPAGAMPAMIGDQPATYAGVPALGPKLPGDLGRPILLKQRQMESETFDPVVMRGSAPPAQANRNEQRDAARSAGLMVAITARPASPAVEPAWNGDQTQSDPVRLALQPETDPNNQQRKSDFRAATDTKDAVNAHMLQQPVSPNMVMAGSIISASLITAIQSDLPGIVTAQVTEQVFDSMTGATLLIPQGTRLIGSYDSVVAFGQKRAFVAWQRLIFPDGSSLSIDNVPAADRAGHSGLVDRVDMHGLALLKGAAISTLLGVGANFSLSGESDLVEAIRQSTQQNVARAGDQLTSRTLQIQPSITIRPGAPVTLVVHRDLILKPWRR